MKLRLFVLSLFISCSITMTAQDTARLVDRVFTTDRMIYVGQITEDVKGDSLVIVVYGTGPHTVTYNRIKKIQYRVDNPSYVDHDADAAPKSIRKVPRDTATLDLVAFNGYRATPKISDKLIKKRNTGIILTVAGACIAGVGGVIYAVTPRYTVSGQTGLSTPSAGAVVGVAMMVAGIGITIPGAAIWGSYAHKLRKAEQEN